MTDEVDNPPPPPSEDLTPDEEKKFTKFLDKFLAKDDTGTSPAVKATVTNAPTGPPPSSSIDVEAAVARALDARESKSKDAEWRTSVEARLGQVTEPKKRKWFEPWTLFSGIM
jgi:hypothetical protein